MYPKYISAPIDNAANLASEFTGELVQRARVLNAKARSVMQIVSDGMVVSARQVSHRVQEVGLRVGHRVQEVGVQVGNRTAEAVGKLANVSKDLLLQARLWTVRHTASESVTDSAVHDVPPRVVTPLSIV